MNDSSSARQIVPGRPYPLGATWTGEGVQFALFSEYASRVDLCLFDAEGKETERLRLPVRTNHVWHGFVPGLQPGQLYGYRIDGPYEPHNGHRFNPAKLLLDPYAKATSGSLAWDDALYDYQGDDRSNIVGRDGRDSAAFMPKGVVVDDAFDWEGTVPPERLMRETVIYELHVRGFSKLWREIPEADRGTYRAIGSDAAIAYFKKLGVTAVELLPVHLSASERYLVGRGLSNYWGYNTLGYFAPHDAYAAADDPQERVREFKEMVKRLHRAGLEVVLDVVYNHTAEGGDRGPSLFLRGCDGRAYYRHYRDEPGRFRDYTGCGNTVDATHPFGMRLVLDSLRYWADEMGVDGFRFDLAPTLGRDGEHDAFNPRAPFLDAIRQDPTLARVKLIAEPWDVGEGGYQVGGFPDRWSEWNGRYRDHVRRFWRGDEWAFADFATRVTGSPDLYASNGREAEASVNFVTCHDGFTLRDLVSYEQKRNEANGNKNEDGEGNNLSSNCGAEGETSDEAVLALRRRKQRGALATLFLSRGVPLLFSGDERNRTQAGNNNGYCHDSPLTWQSWEPDAAAETLAAFVARLAELRRVLGVGAFDGTDGSTLRLQEPGEKEGNKGGGLQWTGPSGTWLLYVHNGREAGCYALPGPQATPGLAEWEEVLDTYWEEGVPEAPSRLKSGAPLEMAPFSLRLLKLVG